MALIRLEGNTHNFWVAIAVQDGSNFTLTNIDARSQISSPVRLEGKGSAYEGESGYGVELAGCLLTPRPDPASLFGNM